MGIAPVPNSRRPKDTDPGPRDFLYSTKYAFCPERYLCTVHHTLTNGISNHCGSQVRGIKEGEGEIAVLARNLVLVGGQVSQRGDRLAAR